MSETENTAERLNALLAEAGQKPLSPDQTAHFSLYLELLLRWNTRINLTAVRDEAGILSRHFLECIGCARGLPAGIGTLLDFGSGAGLPGIPIAICRPEIAVMLAESQGKKAAFLREAVRVLGVSVGVHAGRAETMGAGFDCVTLRAVDKMEKAVREASRLVKAGGWLALMTTEGDLPRLKAAAVECSTWNTVPLPGSERRILALGKMAS